MLDPNSLAPDFRTVSSGYLATPARALPDLLRRLPPAGSAREFGIRAAVAHGVAHPERWDKNRAPIKNLRKPVRSADGSLIVMYDDAWLRAPPSRSISS